MRYLAGSAATAALLALLAGSLPAAGQEQASGTEGTSTVRLLNADQVDLDDWTYGNLYEGTWRAGALLGLEVQDRDEDEVGEVADLVVGRDGRIRSVIIEPDGIITIGEDAVSVPWGQLRVPAHLEHVSVRVTEDRLEEQEPYGEAPGDDPAGRAWRVSDLVGDQVRLRDGVGHGEVEDVLFDKDGRVTAVVVAASRDMAAGGRYPVPFRADEDWLPDLDILDLPYGQPEVADLEPFDYGRMEPQALASAAAD